MPKEVTTPRTPVRRNTANATSSSVDASSLVLSPEEFYGKGKGNGKGKGKGKSPGRLIKGAGSPSQAVSVSVEGADNQSDGSAMIHDKRRGNRVHLKGEAEKKAEGVVLRAWYLKPVKGANSTWWQPAVRLGGMIDGDGDRSVDDEAAISISLSISPNPPVSGSGSKSKSGKWSTGIVTVRQHARLVETASGNRYNLSGPLKKQTMIEAGFSPVIVNAFSHGFPDNWSQLISSWCVEENLRLDEQQAREQKVEEEELQLVEKEATPNESGKDKEKLPPKAKEEAVKVKRPRGRPRSTPRKVEEEEKEEIEKEKEKEVKATEAAEVTEPIKRKRGRPRSVTPSSSVRKRRAKNLTEEGKEEKEEEVEGPVSVEEVTMHVEEKVRKPRRTPVKQSKSEISPRVRGKKSSPIPNRANSSSSTPSVSVSVRKGRGKGKGKGKGKERADEKEEEKVPSPTTVVSPTVRISRSGRSLVPPCEYWRHQNVVYALDGSTEGGNVRSFQGITVGVASSVDSKPRESSFAAVTQHLRQQPSTVQTGTGTGAEQPMPLQTPISKEMEIIPPRQTRQADAPWSSSELADLRSAMLDVVPDRNYWRHVAQRLNTGRSAAECSRCSEKMMGKSATQLSTSAASKQDSKVAPLEVTAKKGTQRRKKQIRSVMRHLDADHVDDIFAGKHEPRSAIQDEARMERNEKVKDLDSNDDDFMTPINYKKAGKVGETPGGTSIFSPTLLTTPDEAVSDAMVSHLQKSRLLRGTNLSSQTATIANGGGGGGGGGGKKSGYGEQEEQVQAVGKRERLAREYQSLKAILKDGKKAAADIMAEAEVDALDVLEEDDEDERDEDERSSESL
jgi:hypothetical protein